MVTADQALAGYENRTVRLLYSYSQKARSHGFACMVSYGLPHYGTDGLCYVGIAAFAGAYRGEMGRVTFGVRSGIHTLLEFEEFAV